jgi:exonuclease III
MRCLLSAGRNVVLVGDLNISPFLRDTHHKPCDFDANRPDRVWLRGHMISPPPVLAAAVAAAAAAQRGGSPEAPGGGGPSAAAAKSLPPQKQQQSGGAEPSAPSPAGCLGLVDVFRAFHPHRESAFTCWPTATGARVNNWGTRIDHILAAQGAGHLHHQQHHHHHHQGPFPPFLEWIAWSDIMPQVEGSDHAPILADFRVPAPLLPANCDPPRVACCTYYTFKSQSSLKSWLTAAPAPALARAASAPLPSQDIGSDAGSQAHTQTQGSFGGGAGGRQGAGSSSSGGGGAVKRQRSAGAQGSGSGKGQTSLLSFFADKSKAAAGRPGSTSAAPPAPQQQQPLGCTTAAAGPTAGVENTPPVAPAAQQQQQGADQQEHQEDDFVAEFEQKRQRTEGAAAAWKGIMSVFAQNKPKCKGHGEECVIRTVKKDGPTKGKQFWVCARADGPPGVGRCDYFVWAANWDMKTGTVKQGAPPGGGGRSGGRGGGRGGGGRGSNGASGSGGGGGRGRGSAGAKGGH